MRMNFDEAAEFLRPLLVRTTILKVGTVSTPETVETGRKGDAPGLPPGRVIYVI